MGGGSTGSVLANRLSKKVKNTVLVLESGGDPNPITNLPCLNSAILERSDYLSFYKNYQATNRTDVCLDSSGVK